MSLRTRATGGALVRTSLAVISLLLASPGVLAGTVVCSGTVETIAYHANNSFMVRLSSMNLPVYFCNPEITWNIAGYSTGPQTCKMLYAMFLAARESGRALSVVYFDSDDAPTACNTWAAWKSATVRYFEY
jgi:hypothetical protein